jgi:tRNA(Ile)-lysidine synthase TilS/MesJ
MHVIRPLMSCLEDDIRQYAQAMDFPILPCNLCGSQPDAHRAKMKMLVGLLDSMNPNAKRNIHNALGDVRPSHLLDTGLREACGLDGKTGEIVDADRAGLIRGFDGALANTSSDREGGEGSKDEDGAGDGDAAVPQSFIESLL